MYLYILSLNLCSLSRSWSAVASISVGGLRSSSSSSSSGSSSSAGATAGGVDAGRPGANMIKPSVKVSKSGHNGMREIRKCALF